MTSPFWALPYILNQPSFKFITFQLICVLTMIEYGEVQGQTQPRGVQRYKSDLCMFVRNLVRIERLFSVAFTVLFACGFGKVAEIITLPELS